jgi:hypothetical protein
VRERGEERDLRREIEEREADRAFAAMINWR